MPQFGTDFLHEVMGQTTANLGEFLRSNERIDPTGGYGFRTGIDPSGGFLPQVGGISTGELYRDASGGRGWQQITESWRRAEEERIQKKTEATKAAEKAAADKKKAEEAAAAPSAPSAP